MSLFLKEVDHSQPIGFIEDGELDGNIIYLQNDDEEYSASETESDESENEFFQPVSGAGLKRIKIRHGRIVPIPSEKRFVDYVVGMSGSGKSTYASKIIDKYHRLYPKNDIYLFSMKDKDPVFTPYEKNGIMTRIVLDETLLETDPKEVVDINGDSLMVFDDVDAMADINPTMMKKINAIRKYIMEVGRAANVSIINCSHDINHIGVNRDFSRKMMNEMTSLTFFNKTANIHQLEYCLKKYFSMDPEEIKSLRNYKRTRWTRMNRHYPKYILREKDCVMNC
jgi:adenylate kinase family enzyme